MIKTDFGTISKKIYMWKFLKKNNVENREIVAGGSSVYKKRLLNTLNTVEKGFKCY